MKRTYFLPLLAALAACAGDGAYGPQGPGGPGPMTHFGYGHVGPLFGILLLICIGLVVFCVTRGQCRREDMQKDRDPPLDILKRRYAKGEITREEFEQMKKDLEP